MTEPVNRTILLLDIERFGQRDDVEQAFMRRMLYAILQETLQHAGIEQLEQRLEDRGDSVMVLISPTVSKVRLLRALLTETPALLHSNNRLAANSAQVRLRIVLAAGEVAIQELGGALGGAVGWDLNQAFRLLNSDVLRSALKERTAQSVLCVSDAVYQGIVRHSPHGVPGAEFQRITVAGKEGELTAWLHGNPAAVAGAAAPGPGVTSNPAEPSDSSQQAPIGTYFLGGSPSFGGSLVNGDQHIVSGGHVHGDVNIGRGGAR
ncbi:hypothetical protein P3T36_000476 [Kitasatospora sp. MAP12-15]|uniref:hypothetical protein n=1 Tax=unclassified Kitasatospora TaxID=2633591 RepID=UPI002477068A|nr:hypothetical protein [Kitasatospora sp. MAP12-44]MDH6109705.1 hypothetical protein [Kitasatospora sp. MAP12-44]